MATSATSLAQAEKSLFALESQFAINLYTVLRSNVSFFARTFCMNDTLRVLRKCAPGSKSGQILIKMTASELIIMCSRLCQHFICWRAEVQGSKQAIARQDNSLVWHYSPTITTALLHSIHA